MGNPPALKNFFVCFYMFCYRRNSFLKFFQKVKGYLQSASLRGKIDLSGLVLDKRKDRFSF